MAPQFRLLLLAVIILLLVGIAYILSPVKVVDTVRFFPRYNPLAQDLTQRLPGLDTIGPDLAAPLKDSRLVQAQVPFTDNVSRRVIIYLPAAYDPRRPQAYPVIYFLHGFPGRAADLASFAGGNIPAALDAAIEDRRLGPYIAVFPEGSSAEGQNPQYLDAFDGSEPNGTFISSSLVSFIDSHLHTYPNPQARVLFGLSTGGFGALNLGLKKPDVFGAIIAISGYGRVERNDWSARWLDEQPDFSAANSPLDYVPNLSSGGRPRVLLLTGQADALLDPNRELFSLLRARGFAVELKLYPGGKSWSFWRTHIPDALTWINASPAPQPSIPATPPSPSPVPSPTTRSSYEPVMIR